MRRAALLAAALACLGRPLPSAPGDSAAASEVRPWLQLGLSARQAALARAGAAAPRGAEALVLDPAGLAGVDGWSFGWTHLAWVEEGWMEELLLGAGRRDFGGAALRLDYLDYGAVPLSRRGPGGELEDLGWTSPSAALLGLGAGKALGGGLSAGAALEAWREDLLAEIRQGLSLDLGLLWRPQGPLAWGLTLRHWEPGGGADADPGQAELALAAEKGPCLLGVAWSRGLGGRHLFAMSMGLECSISQRLELRIGYSAENDEYIEDFEGLSGGFGINFEKFGVDYAFSDLGLLGFAHRISISSR